MSRATFYELKTAHMSILVRVLHGRVDHVQRDILTPAGWEFAPTPEAVRTAIEGKPPSVLMSLGFRIYSFPSVISTGGGVIQQLAS